MFQANSAMGKQRLLFLCVFFLALILRIWRLGEVPEGFYSDEALYGYEAYSLLKTGKDQFGNFLPLSIAGFGDFRPALYIYSTIPSIVVFGLTEFGTRLPSAVFSLATLIVAYQLVKTYLNRKVALTFMLILAISPWSLFFGRMAHEANLTTLLIICGVFFLTRSGQHLIHLLITVVFFTASLYTYHSARVFVPLSLLFTGFLFFEKVKKNAVRVGVGVILFLVLTLPLSLEFTGEGGSRIRGVSIWDDPGLVLRINEARGQFLAAKVSPLLARLVANKVTFLTQEILINFTEEISPRFLLLKGDPNEIYNTPNAGILLWIEPLLILGGIGWWWKRKRRSTFWIIGILFIGVLPDVLTRFNPSSARIHHLLPITAFLSGTGIVKLTRNLTARLVICLLIAVNLTWFWYHYLWVRPRLHARVWQTGTKEMILKAQKLSHDFDKIWISRSGWGWIHLVFHTKYPPDVLQNELITLPRNDLGFWWVSNVGKYYLEWLPDPLLTDPSTLYIGTPDEFPLTVKPLEVIRDRFGNERYWFVSTAYQ